MTKRREPKVKMTARERRIYRHLRRHQRVHPEVAGRTADEVMTALNASSRAMFERLTAKQVFTALVNMRRKNVVVRWTGADRRVHWDLVRWDPA